MTFSLRQKTLDISTKGRGFIPITEEIAEQVNKLRVGKGLCNVFLHHTSASLILCENADPLVLRDLEVFMQRLVPDGDKIFQHNYEGPDDMPAHVRSVLTTNSIAIPIINGNLGLGTWQGIYLWEHRIKGHSRKLTITLVGEE